MKQIDKLYKKEFRKHKEKKSYVVSRNFNGGGKSKTPRGVKMVDKRLKKDQRSQLIKKKKGSVGKKKGKGGKR